MTILHRLASRVLGAPLLVEQARLETILSVLGPRIGIDAPAFDAKQPWPEPHGSSTATKGGIAIVPICGTLVKRGGVEDALSGLLSYSAVENMIMDAATDPAVSAVLLDIDSPGGEVGDVFDLVAMIQEARSNKPVWAVANDAYSAAYMIAAACDRIFVPQAAGVGSIGVIAVHVDESQMDASLGRKYTPIFAGKQKNDFSRHEPLSTEASKRLQGEIDRLYGMFVGAVASGRKMSEEVVRATEAGIFYGESAVKVGLADQVGTMREALMSLSSFTSPTKTSSTKSKRESRMETPIPGAEASKPTTEGTEAVPQSFAQFQALSQANAQAIVEMCEIAGEPAMAGQFIAKGLSQEAVRGALLKHRAEAGAVEIASTVMGGAGTAHNDSSETYNAETNPVVQACKRRADTTKKGG